MEYTYRAEEGRIVLTANGCDVAYLKTVKGATDTLTEIEPGLQSVSFHTMSGKLTVEKKGDWFTMYFPTRAPKPVEIPELLEKALGCKVLECTLSRDLVALVESEETVANLEPDIELI